MCMTESCHADKIDHEPERAHNKQFANPLHFTTHSQPFNGLVHNFNADQPGASLVGKFRIGLGLYLHEKYAVGESSQGIHLAVSIGKSGAWGPFAHHSGA